MQGQCFAMYRTTQQQFPNQQKQKAKGRPFYPYRISALYNPADELFY